MKLFKKILYWFDSILYYIIGEGTFRQQVIGTAQLDDKCYFFIRKSGGIFLVSDVDKHIYSKKIIFPNSIHKHTSSVKDLDSIILPDGKIAITGTIKVDGIYKTIYLTSKNSTRFKLESMIDNPDGSATKIVINNNKKVFFLTSVDGEICYRKLKKNNLDVKHKSTGLGPRHDSFDHGPLRIIGTFHLNDGVFVLYEVSYDFPGYQTHKFGAALLAHDNLSHVHWRAFFDEIPFWEQFISRKESNESFETLGAHLKNDIITVYFYEQTQKNIYTLDLHEPYSRRDPSPKKAILKKHINNPIINPNPKHEWECNAVFNSTAIQIDDTTHLLYRAEGSAGLSVVGYGKSNNSVEFDCLPDPIYVPRMDFEGVNLPPEMLKSMRRASFKSGYNHYPTGKTYDWHGVEDPRVTELENRIYMIYAAFNGYNYARPAITSIDKNDFLSGNWNWEIPQVMTEQSYNWGDGNKCVVLHPEKVNGKYMIYHRFWPHIRIDYVDDLNFGPGKRYLKEVTRIEARGDSWDSYKVGVSAAPIKINEGWLLIYQGSGSQDRRYKIGAMILDYDDPSKVLYRSNYPIMVPNEWYEGGIAYACGAIVREGTLYVYYGGDDKYVCVASAPLLEFIDKLKKDPYQKPETKKHKNISELCT